MQERNINRKPLMLVLISGAFVAILNQTLLGTALPHIMEDLQLDPAVAQWLQSAFMLVNGIMIPITALLIERFTTRALFISALGSFAIGTFFAAVAPNFTMLMIGRILQAAGAGIMMPLTQTIMFLIFPIHQRGRAMGMFGLVIDRKSTRLNSSHVAISYAVFCLKKKNILNKRHGNKEQTIDS